MSEEEQAFYSRVIECVSFTIVSSYQFIQPYKEEYLAGMLEYIRLGADNLMDHIVSQSIPALRRASRLLDFTPVLPEFASLLDFLKSIKLVQTHTDIVEGYSASYNMQLSSYIDIFLENLPQMLQRQGARFTPIYDHIYQLLDYVLVISEDAQVSLFESRCCLSYVIPTSQPEMMLDFFAVETNWLRDTIIESSANFFSFSTPSYYLLPVHLCVPLKRLFTAMNEAYQQQKHELLDTMYATTAEILSLLAVLKERFPQVCGLEMSRYTEDGDQQEIVNIFRHAINFWRNCELVYDVIVEKLSQHPQLLQSFGFQLLKDDLERIESYSDAATYNSLNHIEKLKFASSFGLVSAVLCQNRAHGNALCEGFVGKFRQSICLAVQVAEKDQSDMLVSTLAEAVIGLGARYDYRLQGTPYAFVLETVPQMEALFAAVLQRERGESIELLSQMTRFLLLKLQLALHSLAGLRGDVQPHPMSRLQLQNLDNGAQAQCLLNLYDCLYPQGVIEVVFPVLFGGHGVWLTRTFEEDEVRLVARYAAGVQNQEVQWWLAGFGV